MAGESRKTCFSQTKKHRQPVTDLIPILYIDRYWLLAIQRFSNLEQSVNLFIFWFKCRSKKFHELFLILLQNFFFPEDEFLNC